jgi:hypothetical protein
MTGRRYVAAVLAAVALGGALGACGGGDDDDAADDTEEPTGTTERDGTTGTTMNTGGLEVAAPDGWQTIPVPDIGIGLAVPPGWEATVLSPEGLSTLAGASPTVPGFTDLAHAAAAQGGLLYAAGADPGGGISDVMVRATPGTGVTDAASLKLAAEMTAANSGTDPTKVTVVEGAAFPTAIVPFALGGPTTGGTDRRDAQARALVIAGPGDVLWEVTVAADDVASLDQLTEQIRTTLAFTEPEG